MSLRVFDLLVFGFRSDSGLLCLGLHDILDLCGGVGWFCLLLESFWVVLVGFVCLVRIAGLNVC